MAYWQYLIGGGIIALTACGKKSAAVILTGNSFIIYFAQCIFY
jgi:hypothetical protein